MYTLYCEHQSVDVLQPSHPPYSKSSFYVLVFADPWPKLLLCSNLFFYIFVDFITFPWECEQHFSTLKYTWLRVALWYTGHLYRPQSTSRPAHWIRLCMWHPWFCQYSAPRPTSFINCVLFQMSHECMWSNSCHNFDEKISTYRDFILCVKTPVLLTAATLSNSLCYSCMTDWMWHWKCID